jgi:hypothetical protein
MNAFSKVTTDQGSLMTNGLPRSYFSKAALSVVDLMFVRNHDGLGLFGGRVRRLTKMRFFRSQFYNGAGGFRALT